MASLLTQAQDRFWRLADWLHATWAGLGPGAEWLLGALLLLGLGFGLLLGLGLGRPSPAVAAEAPLPAPAHADTELLRQAQAQLATLQAELATLHAAEARRQHDADAGVQAFCTILAPALSALSEAAEQGRTSAAECAARADAVHACMADASEDAARTATTLAAVTRHVESLALSVEAIAATLNAVAEAIGPDQEAARDAATEGEAAAAPPSLVSLAAESGIALANLVATLHATTAAADAVAGRVAQVRDAAESGSTAAQGMAQATETVGRNAIAIGLEFTSFLDSLSRAGNRRRFDRYPTELDATIAADGRQHTARIVNISRGGCAMDGDCGIETGTEATLMLPGIEEALRVRVARRLGSITGLEFLDDDPLAGILETLIVEPMQAA
jgi:methyl-accepting chemotaxis protein